MSKIQRGRGLKDGKIREPLVQSLYHAAIYHNVWNTHLMGIVSPASIGQNMGRKNSVP